MRNGIRGIFLLIVAGSFLTCGGEDGGSGHLSVAVSTFSSSTAVIYYADANCPSLAGTSFVGVVQDRCGDAFVTEPVTDCTAFQMDFSKFGDAEDVTGSAVNASRPLQVINDCDGIISGTLDGESGSCLLTGYASEPTCRCEINTTVSPTTHNEAFASEITQSLATFREVLEDARFEVFEGLADEENAIWDEQSGPNFLFPCNAL